MMLTLMPRASYRVFHWAASCGVAATHQSLPILGTAMRAIMRPAVLRLLRKSDSTSFQAI
jgi:hypothetical protein